MQITVNNPDSNPGGRIPLTSFPHRLQQPRFFEKVPFDGVIEPWPAADIAGNDDTDPLGDEDNDPYNAVADRGLLNHAIGEVTSDDSPQMLGPSPGGLANETRYGVKYEFREFLRLQIGPQWYRVSANVDWSMEMKAVVQNGPWANDGSDYHPR